MKLNVEARYTYFITKRESCFEFMYCTDRLFVESKYTNYRILCKLRSRFVARNRYLNGEETVISAKFHDKLSTQFQPFTPGSLALLQT